LPISHDRQKRDHAALREICLHDGILLLVQEHALFKDYLFEVGLKEREICMLKRRQQTILADWRGAIVNHTRSLPLEPVELMTAVMGGGAPGQRPTEIKCYVGARSQFASIKSMPVCHQPYQRETSEIEPASE
jgi:hypothetical protein